MKLCLSPVLALLVLSSACNAPDSVPPNQKPVASAAPVQAPSNVATAPAAASAPVAAVAHVSALAVGPAALSSPSVRAAASLPAPTHTGESSLEVKRFVVAGGVKDREPLSDAAPLAADGSAIYAFAELANPLGDSEDVRITFERKGGAERVGDVTLAVPASTLRYRTWAFTRFIRVPGVWEAVLWSAGGAELGRASFEVKAS